VVQAIPCRHVTRHSGQLTVLSSDGQGMCTGQGAGGKVTVGLASHRPYVTDSVVYACGLNGGREMSNSHILLYGV